MEDAFFNIYELSSIFGRLFIYSFCYLLIEYLQTQTITYLVPEPLVNIYNILF